MRLFRPLTLLCAATLAVACGDSTAPKLTPGTYSASASSASARQGSFTTTTDGQTTDWLAQGGSIVLTLRADGTTAGRLFLPGIGSDENPNDGSDFDADLTGTWSQTGSTVHLSHAADTFLRDMTFEVDGSTLVGDRVFGDVRVRVVLERTS